MWAFSKLDVEMEKEQQRNLSAQIRFSHAHKRFYCMPLKKCLYYYVIFLSCCFCVPGDKTN